MENNKIEVETIVQFAIALLQCLGLFLIRPDMFDLYHHQNPFLAGNLGIYIMALISIGYFISGVIFNQPIHTKYWIAGMMITAVIFLICFFKYNKDLHRYTFLAVAPADLEPVRVIRGTNYREDIVQRCAIFRGDKRDINEMDVIQQCAELTDWTQIDKIWPAEEIISNTSLLLIDYYLCLLFASISLISGVQTIKCVRNKKQIT